MQDIGCVPDAHRNLMICFLEQCIQVGLKKIQFFCTLTSTGRLFFAEGPGAYSKWWETISWDVSWLETNEQRPLKTISLYLFGTYPVGLYFAPDRCLGEFRVNVCLKVCIVYGCSDAQSTGSSLHSFISIGWTGVGTAYREPSDMYATLSSTHLVVEIAAGHVGEVWEFLILGHLDARWGFQDIVCRRLPHPWLYEVADLLMVHQMLLPSSPKWWRTESAWAFIVIIVKQSFKTEARSDTHDIASMSGASDRHLIY